MMGVEMVRSKHRSAWMGLYFFLVIAAITADQWSKWWVSHYLSPGQMIKINDFFSIALLHNRGAAFGFLSQSGVWAFWFLLLLALFAVFGIVVWLWRLSMDRSLLAFPLSLVLGGAIGNLADRLRLGYVVDFLYVHYQHWSWPTFNVADSFICVGVIGLLWLMLMHKN
jgi:signal peptidase II